MRTWDDLHSFQIKAIQRGVAWPSSALFLDVGLGKTAIGLAVAAELLDRFEVTGVLVVASKRIVETVWRQEAMKWEFSQHLKFCDLRGTVRQRAVRLHTERADIWLINYEQYTSLVEDNLLVRKKPLPFQMIIFDEISKMANPEALRCKAHRTLMRKGEITRRMGLTATPATNGLIKLFGEYLALDDGEHLGRSQENFKWAYFSRDYNGRWEPDDNAKDRIFYKVRHMTYAMKSKLNLKEPLIRDVPVYLPPTGRQVYEDLEQKFFAELDSGEVVEVFNAAAKTNKCLQAANGALYTGDVNAPQKRGSVRAYSEVHEAKLDAVEDLLEALEGHSALLCYPFRMDAARIKARFGAKYQIKDIHDYKDAAQAVAHVRQGKLDLLTGHPASMAHGIDGLQDNACHLIWFGLVWDLELYEQAIGRLHRQGQKRQVVVHRIVAENTLDYAVIEALNHKHQTQQDFLDILRDYTRRKHHEDIDSVVHVRKRQPVVAANK